jgi:hypothetical protein
MAANLPCDYGYRNHHVSWYLGAHAQAPSQTPLPEVRNENVPDGFR